MDGTYESESSQLSNIKPGSQPDKNLVPSEGYNADFLDDQSRDTYPLLRQLHSLSSVKDRHERRNHKEPLSKFSKTVLAVGASAAAVAISIVVIGDKISSMIPDMPWNGNGKAIGNAAQGVIDNFNTTRVERPLRVDPTDILMGKIGGGTANGEAFGIGTRRVVIKKAVKKYEGEHAWQDEYVKLYDGEYEGQGHVPGKLTYEYQEKAVEGVLTVSLPAVELNQHVTTIRVPRIVNQPNFGPAVVQAGPGKETDTSPTVQEERDFVDNIIQNDMNLKNYIACGGIATVESLINGLAVNALNIGGWDVKIEGSRESESSSSPIASLPTTNAPERKNLRIIITAPAAKESMKTLNPGSCASILEDTTVGATTSGESQSEMEKIGGTSSNAQLPTEIKEKISLETVIK